MAKYREFSDSSTATTSEPAPARGVEPGPAVADRSIGEIIRVTRNLTADQVEQVLQHQRDKGVRFGEAAIALGFATPDDVLYALSQQFHYPYAAEDHRRHSSELVVLNQPFGHQSEAFRAIRSQVMMRLYADGMPRRALAVVSPDAGDGKTFFTVNLGASLAQLGGRTLIVDADMRGPRIHEIFGISNNSGLSGILSGRAEAKVIQAVQGIPSLFVLPVGVTPPNPLELVERPAFALLMRELTTKFDHVVVDTPAAVYGADANVIAARCGVALVVARKDKARVSALHDLTDALGASSAQLAGVVVNEF